MCLILIHSWNAFPMLIKHSISLSLRIDRWWINFRQDTHMRHENETKFREITKTLKWKNVLLKKIFNLLSIHQNLIIYRTAAHISKCASLKSIKMLKGNLHKVRERNETWAADEKNFITKLSPSLSLSLTICYSLMWWNTKICNANSKISLKASHLCILKFKL